MNVAQILALTGLAVLLGFLRRGRMLVLMGFSALVIYWLQPASLVFPSLSFWLPTLTIFITVLVWVITAPPGSRSLRRNWPALAVLVGVVVFVVAGARLSWKYFPVSGSIVLVAIALVILVGLTAGLSLIKKGSASFFPSLRLDSSRSLYF